MGMVFISCRESECYSSFAADGCESLHFEGRRVDGAYMIGVRVGGVVQDHRLGQVPLQDAEVFDVVALNADAILLIQSMPVGDTQRLKAEQPKWHVSIDDDVDDITAIVDVSRFTSELLNEQSPASAIEQEVFEVPTCTCP